MNKSLPCARGGNESIVVEAALCSQWHCVSTYVCECVRVAQTL